MPRVAASWGSRIWQRSPSTSMVPPSGSTSPISTFISVDLPAPFSPRTPWMRPRWRVKSTRSQATMAPNDLDMEVSRTAGTSVPAVR